MILPSQTKPAFTPAPKTRGSYFTRCDQDGLAKAWAKLREAEGWRGGWRIAKAPVDNDGAKADRLKIHATAKDWMTGAEIAGAIGMDRKTCRARITTMVKVGMMDTLGGRPQKFRALPESRWSAVASGTKLSKAIALLADGPKSAGELAESMGENPKAMSLVMTRAFNAGRVSREYCKRPTRTGGGNGFYRYSVVRA